MITIPPTRHVFAFKGEGAKIEPYAPCVYINDSDIDFIAPEGSFIVAVVINDTDRPLRKRGMIFPVNGLESYVYKRSLLDKFLHKPRKPAIPPRAARVVLLTLPVNQKLFFVNITGDM